MGSEVGADDFSPKWANRGVSPEIVEAVKTGWLPSAGPVLDIGCGLGEIAAWFGAARSSGARLRYRRVRRHGALKRRMRPFHPISNSWHSMLRGTDTQSAIQDIDRPRLPSHHPAQNGYELYAQYCVGRSAGRADAAFHKGISAWSTVRGSMGDGPARDVCQECLRGKVQVERHAPTYMKPQEGANGAPTLPGLVFWLEAPGGGDEVDPNR